jgi:hypothetical protein
VYHICVASFAACLRPFVHHMLAYPERFAAQLIQPRGRGIAGVHRTRLCCACLAG